MLDGKEQPCATTKRVRLQLTVAPITDDRMRRLSDRLTSNKGRLVDKLVEALWVAYDSHKQTCITGRPCKLDLTDLPEVF